MLIFLVLNFDFMHVCEIGPVPVYMHAQFGNSQDRFGFFLWI